MLAYLTLELRRTLRNGMYLFWVVAWPAAAYLLFSSIFGGEPRTQGLPPVVEIMVAMAAFGAVGAVTTSGTQLALERHAGWVRQMRLTPLPATQMLLAKGVAALCLTLPAVCITLALAAGIHGVRLGAGQWLAIIVFTGIGCLPFLALGLLIGSVTSADVAPVVTTGAYIGFSALGGLWVPVVIFPSAMQTLAHVLPSYRVADLGWRVAAGQPPDLVDLAVLGAWFVGLGLMAVAASRRLVLRD